MPLLEARIWIHVGEVEISKDDVHGLAVNQLCKAEKTAKFLVTPGAIVVTKAVKELANPTLFPKQCRFTPLKGPKAPAGPERLFTIDMTAELAFMISQQRKAQRPRVRSLTMQESDLDTNH